MMEEAIGDRHQWANSRPVDNLSFGCCLLDRLDYQSIIACNATVDPNKILDSDYSLKIVNRSP
jgi:hypothetical protein